jgi:hypothetical protein
LPFVEQAATPLSTHACFGSVAPAPTGAHVPALPETLQAWHEPQVALPQQTPSTQWLVAHWSSAAHAVPCAIFATQLPPAPVQ